MFLYHVLLNTDIISVVLLVVGIFVFVTLRLNYYKQQLHRFMLKSQTTISVQHNCILGCNHGTNQFSNISSALLKIYLSYFTAAFNLENTKILHCLGDSLLLYSFS